MERLPLSKKYVQEEKFLNALAEAYRLQEAIIGTTELSIISTSTEGSITSFNKAAELMLGYSSEEVLGKPVFSIFHDIEEIKAHSKEISKELGVPITPDFSTFSSKPRLTKSAERKEWTYIRKDGTRFPVLLSVTALWDDSGELIGYASIATDITERRRAESKIINSESHLHSLVKSLDDIVLEIDENGNYLNLWSQHNDHIFVSKETQPDTNIYHLLDKEVGDKYKTVINRVITTGHSEVLEYKSVSSSGEYWRNAKFSFVSVNRILICIRDITNKKQAELELIKSESKFRTLAENIPGVIYLCNNDATYSMLYLNQKVEDVTGYTADDFISGRINFVKLFHPDDAASIIERVDNALLEKKSFQITYRLRHKSGEWRWVEEMGIGVYYDNTLLLIEGFINDITIQKTAEEKLQTVAEENYRLFNDTVNLTAIAGFDGYFKRMNSSWTKLLGWSEEEMISTQYINFVHPDDVESTRAVTNDISQGHHVQNLENRVRCKDGSYKWLLWGTASDPKRHLMYASAIDITERKKYEEELLRSKQNLEIVAVNLQEQNRLLDEFAHIISHNLRSPIGNIQALIGLLNKSSSIDDYQTIFDKLKNVSKNLGDTMNELMDTLKVKTNTDIERVEIRFKDILDKVVQSLEGEMIHFGATLTYDFNAAPKILYSKTYLESIFQNLLNNALKYSSPDRKPEIRVKSAIRNGRIEVLVSDNGLGIDLEKFGDKLFGLHKTFHDHKEAKGVGLFLTKTQIEAMGGSIKAQSKVNEGTTFIITFEQSIQLKL